VAFGSHELPRQSNQGQPAQATMSTAVSFMLQVLFFQFNFISKSCSVVCVSTSLRCQSAFVVITYKKGHKRVVLNNMSIGNLDVIVCDVSIVNLEKIVLFNMSIEDLYRILFNI
jgi:hypothetical protein